MTNEEFNDVFRRRTMEFAVRVFRLIENIPFNTSTKIINYQLGKSASSVGANFRAFCRGRSKAERFAKICIVVEEADECEYWLEMLRQLNFGDQKEVQLLLQENLEIIKVCQRIKTKFSSSH